jgi:phosphoribosylglycinamide formyltransferase-1
MIQLAIFISGGGSNAQAIARYFEASEQISVNLLVTNNASSQVLPWFESKGIETLVIQNEDLHKEAWILEQLKNFEIDAVVLAGFLRKIPTFLVAAFPDRILNIHPSLLPKFGGKGMYGIRVHEAVLGAGEKRTGITIHLVNEAYDEGGILAQYELEIPASAKPQDLMQQIQVLEHRYYPVEIEKYLKHVF